MSKRTLPVCVALSLALLGGGCQDSTTSSSLPEARFSMEPTEGAVPLTVNFIDLSINGPTEWNWDFGDGTTSDVANPHHTYTEAGCYTVKLAAYNAAGGDEETKVDCITANDTTPVTVSILPWYEVMATVRTINVTAQSTETTTVETYTWPNWEPVVGGLVDSVIDFTWNTTDGYDNPYTGTMRITLDHELTRVISLSVEATILHGTPPWGTRTVTFRAHNIGLADQAPTTSLYRVWGSGCAVLIDELTEELVSNDGSMHRSIMGFTCDDTSRVEVRLTNIGD